MSDSSDNRPRLIGIGGGSGSGKSTLARHLEQALGETHALLISLDAYYLDRNAVPAAIRGNVDHPESMDAHLLGQHLDRLCRGESIDLPVYDFHTHTRTPKTCRLEPRPVILLDGVLLFALEPVRSRLDLSIFVDVPADLRLARRLLRDVAERGRSPQSVVEQYLATVRPMHARFVEPWKAQADYCITNERHFEPALEQLLPVITGMQHQLSPPDRENPHPLACVPLARGTRPAHPAPADRHNAPGSGDVH
ncbi:MAG: uridine kinase [Thiothrix sp.]|nr:uridine kinase [Thiothrix sp.]HPE60753.1 uridine kinase [Thiolinea sp.]